MECFFKTSCWDGRRHYIKKKNIKTEANTTVKAFQWEHFITLGENITEIEQPTRKNKNTATGCPSLQKGQFLIFKPQFEPVIVQYVNYIYFLFWDWT